ncbi:MAG: hypothetical protein JWO30_2249 [Fibrobacteres bacterium]|nr:hypothetical protein [Fibrobacterota bacterium]
MRDRVNILGHEVSDDTVIRIILNFIVIIVSLFLK